MKSKVKYDYSLINVDYSNKLPYAKDKIRVICKIHGEFLICYDTHKRGMGCPFCSGKMQKGYWTKKRCIEDARRFKSRSDWNKISGSSYNVARRNNWLEECCKHIVPKRKPKGYWTLERCIKEAKKYKTIKDWKNKSNLYNTVRKNGWMEMCCEHMISSRSIPRKWIKKRCIKEALKYKTRSDWNKVSGASYRAALKNDWMKVCCKHMTITQVSSNFWTNENIILEALKYKTKMEWKKKQRASYILASKNNLFKECCKHMVSGHKLRWKK